MLDNDLNVCYNGSMNKKKKIKLRNWLAIHAHFHKGAGNHGAKKKQDARRACRGYKWTR